METEIPKIFFECLLPITICNLKCEYCYVIQENRRTELYPKMQYSFEQIGKSFSKKRLGGTCFINICGAGETLAYKELPQLIDKILDNGHFINITTNGTQTKMFDQIIKLDRAKLSRINFSFSFHYLELKRLHLLDAYFNNIKKVAKNGCSFLFQMNLCDSYINCIEEIKKVCIEKINCLPQIMVTRNEQDKTFKLFTANEKNYINVGKSFNSKIFEVGLENINVKRNEFCYAGKWSYVLNLANGELKPCYCSNQKYDFFKHPKEKIPLFAVGNNCKSNYCINSTHFLPLGVIPEIRMDTYSQLRNRKWENGIRQEWQTQSMKDFLSHKLCEANQEYTNRQKKKINKKNKKLNSPTFKSKLYRTKLGKSYWNIKHRNEKN